MSHNRKKHISHAKHMLLIALVLLCGSACGRGARHCYLHQGFTYDAPCLVNLANGNITELSVVGNAGHIPWTMTGGMVVWQMPGEHTVASISNAPQKVNTELFCADCLALISEVPNDGYVLADLHDLGDIRLYAVEDDMSLVLQDHQVSAVYEDDGAINIAAESAPNEREQIKR